MLELGDISCLKAHSVGQVVYFDEERGRTRVKALKHKLAVTASFCDA